MAKVKKTKVVDSCCATPCDYKPRLYLDLQEKDVSQIKGLEIGQEVELVVTGVVKGLEQRERMEGEKSMKTGSIQLEGYEVKVMGEETNEFKDVDD